jgi:signal transduction histidine kinase
MKFKSKPIVILSLVFGYVLLQFLWWEILLVKQNGQIINEKQKLMELSFTDASQLRKEIDALHHKKKMQTVMIVGEGTVFLLLLLFGVYKIKQASDKENELNTRQKNFFLSITHELKTPIAATKLQLQTLQKQKLDDDTRKDLINNALEETERLNALIDNVLLASRLDSGELVFTRVKTDLSALVADTLQRYYPQELRSGIIKPEISKNLPASVDPFVLPSVITNLVDNAIKYSPQQKNVVVTLHQNDREVILRVADNGIGIAPAEKKNIFNRFYRSGDEATRKTKGTGLGLYIVKYIAGRHDAGISVKDNNPAGSIFEIRFHAV